MDAYMLEAAQKYFVLRIENEALVRLLYAEDPKALPRNLPPPCGIALEAQKQLREYFAGARCSFSLPMNALGTDFQKKIWRKLTEIPYGKTMSYKELSESVGVPGGARAVGRAVSENPLPIFIPCHRVLAAHGRIGGFRWGLPMKRELLSLEGIAFIG